MSYKCLGGYDMICKFCGNVIEDSSDFCFICGQKVAEEAPAFAWSLLRVGHADHHR